jgi:hypothetical protein
MKEDSSTSDTPYLCVASIKCNENAISERIVRVWFTAGSMVLKMVEDSKEGQQCPDDEELTSQENESSCGENSIIPCVLRNCFSTTARRRVY